MPDTDPQQHAADAITALVSAKHELVVASRNVADQQVLQRVALECNNLQSIIDHLAQARAAADDADYEHATGLLKIQSGSLQTDADAIRALIQDVAMAARVAGYMADAARYIALL